MSEDGEKEAQWEVVLFSGGTRTHRLSVPGGWIYRIATLSGQPPVLTVSTVFVPVPE